MGGTTPQRGTPRQRQPWRVGMKKKLLKLRLPYFFGQRIHSKDPSGNMPELIQPASDWRRAESVMEDILRWADDGGKMFDLENGTIRAEPDAAREQRNKR